MDCSTVFHHYTQRSRVIFVDRQINFLFGNDFCGLLQKKAKSGCGIAFSAESFPNTVADMSSAVFQRGAKIMTEPEPPYNGIIIPKQVVGLRYISFWQIFSLSLTNQRL